MTYTVWKYRIPLKDAENRAATDVTLDMPLDARILHLGSQFGAPMLWAWVDKSAPLVPRHIEIVSTGQDMTGSPQTREYLGTWHIQGFVFHFFEQVLPKEET